MLALYGYFRSSAAFRVRIALALKELEFENIPVHLVRGGGEHNQPDYLALNPQGRVPTLKDGEDFTLGQSLAILEYLEEAYPDTPLLPADIRGRARVRQLAGLVACDIHPLNNLSVLQYLKGNFGAGEEAVKQWYAYWVSSGFKALEEMLAGSAATGSYCHGDSPTMADACLVPQVWNARRFEVALDAFPTICRIEEACYRLPAFDTARPENQPDAVLG